MAENINTDCKINSDEVVELDCTKVSSIFKNLKREGVFKESIQYNNEGYKPPSEELLKSEDFIDHIKYYRILKRMSKRELSQKVGIDDETYRQYELKNYEIQKYEIAEKMLKALEIEDKVELPEYFKIMKKCPLDKIKKIITENISKKLFSEQTGIAISTINTWFQKNRPNALSADSYKKIARFFNDYKVNY